MARRKAETEAAMRQQQELRNKMLKLTGNY